MLIISLLIISLAYFCVVSPYRRYVREQGYKKFQRQYKFFKLKAVQASYPTLQDLSLREIEEKYNLTLIYENIGRHLR